MTKYSYTLKVGADGASRLELLNELCNPLSLSFINKHINLTDKQVLEIGCGIGILSSQLANICLPSGSVLATDISSEQIEIAEKRAAELDITNLTFKQLAADEIETLSGKYDLVYIRFVLAHLEGVTNLLQKITNILNSDGILICEEPVDVESMFCEPTNDDFDWWKKAVFVQIQSVKGNFLIGRELDTTLSSLSMTVLNSKVIQPVMLSTRLKQQLWQGIIEIKDILIKSGFCTEDELEDRVEQLKKLADSPLYKVGLFSYKQIAVKKQDISSSPSQNIRCYK